MWPNLEPGLTRWIDRLPKHASYLDGLMKILANDVIFLVPIVLLILWVRRDGFRPAVEGAVGALLALGITALIGTLWDRKRPFVFYHFKPLISHPADASFPSDHLAVLGAITAAFFAYSHRLGIVTAVVALAVAFARVFVGVHYVSDVVDGFILGAACGTLMWFLARPLSPVLDALDERLRRWHLRPILLGLRGRHAYADRGGPSPTRFSSSAKAHSGLTGSIAHVTPSS
ncbi:MAG: phosphatase PAP2 family protein [Acidimicrobiales bacterium]